MDIDFVVAWVDGDEIEWKKKKQYFEESIKGTNSSDSTNARFRDWGIFKYWFRCVLENAPWVHRVFLVTDHQIPSFLDIENDKLRVVFHDEYIPQEYLPTFSSHTIELNFHRIDDLSEHFVYFNDDMFLNQPVTPKDFFIHGKPCYDLIERPLVPTTAMSLINYVCINNMGVINEHFSRRDLIKKINRFINIRYGIHGLKNLCMLPWNNFQHFADNHMPCPFLKSTFKDVWQSEGTVLDRTSRNKFRTCQDVNQYVMKYWDQARGNFSPYSFKGGYYSINSSNIDACVNDIVQGTHSMICINDACEDGEFYEYSKRICEAFERRYKNKCRFEK